MRPARYARPALGLLALAVSLAACGPNIPPPTRPAPTLPGGAALPPPVPTPAPAPSPAPSPAPAPAPAAGVSPTLAPLLAEAPFAGPTLAVHYLDIGQGDAILVRTPGGKHLLIDSGPERDGARLLGYLGELLVDRIDLAINTHPHSDHIGGLVALMEKMPVGMVLDSGYVHPTRTYERMLAAIEEKKIPLKVARRGRVITVEEGVKLHVLGPEDPLIKGSRSDPNANSVIVRLDYGDLRFLFTGDAEEDTEQRLLRAEAPALRSTVLKVAHHGSRYATHTDFLSAVSPALAVVSAGPDNKYGHPAPETMKRLRAFGVTTLTTIDSGHVVVTTDGQKLRVTQQPRGAKGPVAAFSTAAPTPSVAVSPAPRPLPMARAPAPSGSGVDINRASASELMKLPGVGMVTAGRIIKWREANGGFKTVEQLRKVKGIGAKTMDKLRPLVSVSLPPGS